jgi:GNAT superfamily N-acetyltransferase
MMITKAVPEDLREILDLVEKCILEMNSNGITQWNEQYPPMDIFGSDIEKNTLYKIEINNEITGIIVLSTEQDKEYEPVEWKDIEGNPIVIHRLAVDPRWQRKGIATKLMSFAEKFAKDNGYTSIRIDTFSLNPRMKNLINKFGYDRKTGKIFFPENDEPYYCYEKIF